MNSLRRAAFFAGTCALLVFVAGCAPQQGVAEKPSAQRPGAENVVQVAWTPDMDCATCHTDEDATMGDAAMGACIHVQKTQATCVTCHADESGLSKVHEDATATDKMPKKLKATSVDAETCQAAGCHDLSKDEMLALTADVVDLTDSQGTQVNPHDVMGRTEGHAEILCSDCHNMHTSEVKAADTCVACHHQGVYECNTCH